MTNPSEVIENERAIADLKRVPPKPAKTPTDWFIQIVRDALGVVALIALVIGILNSIQSSGVIECQSSLLANAATRDKILADASVQFRNLERTLSNQEGIQTEALGTILDGMTGGDRAGIPDAVAKYRGATRAKQDALNSYILVSEAAAAEQAKHPTTFNC